jgi:hypothetical protein
MASTSLIFEDRLDGASHFLSWKVRVTISLEENGILDIDKDIVPSFINLQQLETHKKREVKVKQMIMDAIKDHLILGNVNVYAIIIVLCISIDKSIIITRLLRNTHSQETQHLSWETL